MSNYTMQKRYSTPCRVLKPTTKKINGCVVKTYEEGDVFFASVKSYGGTDTIINNVYVIQDTLSIETFYREEIKSNCKVKLLDDNTEWEIINTPEQIDREKKIILFKVKRINPNG